MRMVIIVATVVTLLTGAATTAVAAISTTPAAGGSNLSADLAQNGVAPAFTALGSIVITESQNNDLKTSGTLVLTAPGGWRFNTGAAVTATPGKVGGGSTPIDISASVGAITASSITFNITVNATARLDNLTIGGIQVQAIEGGSLPVSGNVLRTSANPGTATIVGVSNDVTNFGSLSQAIGALRLHVVLPGQSFADGSTVAASGISGVPASQAAGVAFDLVQLVAADRQFNVASSYSGTKTIAYSGPGGSPSYTTSVSFSGGYSTTALATTLRKAESTSLSATSATSPAIATALPSASFVVDAGPAARLQILLPGETAAPGTGSGKTGTPSAQTVAIAIVNNVRVNAVDADWNVIGGAAPGVVISSSDAAAAIADDNGAADGHLALAAGAGILSSFAFSVGGAPQTISATDVAGALGPATSASVLVNKPASSTSLASSQSPTAFGQSVTFTATVTGASATPTGTVDFKDGSTVIGNDIPLDGSGVAQFATSSLSVATHTMSAVYSGSADYNTSTSANLSQVVSKAGTATVLASSINPSCSGQPVTLTATVSVVAPGSGTLTGHVDFKNGSTVIGNDIPLNGSGVATFTTSSLSTTNHNLTAVYNGSGSFTTSTSSPVLVQSVKPKPTAAVSGSATICAGSSASIQAVLGGTAPWTVTWSDGVVQSGVMTSPASRSVSPSVTTIFRVTTVADAYCSNVGSGSATVTVNQPPAISAQPGPKSVCEGGSATFTVSASGGGLTYRWREDGVNLVNGGHVSGATSATLTISSAAAVDAGAYDVVVSGTCSPAQTSAAASLTVKPVPVASIAADSVLCVSSAGNSASVADAGAGASYAWTINGGTITAGAGSPGITYTAGTGKTLTLSVTVTGANGCSASSSRAIAVSDGGVIIEDWKNTPLSEVEWQNPTLQTSDARYPEGGSVPFRLTLPQPCLGGTWSITLQYDFADEATGVHFCDFLTSYNAFEPSVNGHECEGVTCNSSSTFPIPADPSLPYQLPGVFTVMNGTITSASAHSTISTGGVTVKQMTLSGTATSGADVLILFGAHLARDYEWGNNKGAAQWPTGTASLGFIGYSGGNGGAGSAGHTNIKVADGILDNQSQSDVAVVASGSPNPVDPGAQLTYSIIVSNSGPQAAGPDTLSNPIPSGTTFVSATTPAGWNLTAPAAGGTGVVRWFAPSLGAGASASFALVVAVDAGAEGAVVNTVTLATGTVDAYQINNSATVTTPIAGTNPPPPPVATLRGPVCGSILAIGTPLVLSGTFTDEAAGSHTAAWQLDQVEIPGTVNETTGEVSGSHTFSTPGVYLMTLTVSNQMTGSFSTIGDQADSPDAMVVVFDKRYSFIAGYGSFESPAGAWAADPSATGAASFGFETRGTSLRPSQSEVHFMYGDFAFHSTSSDRVEVSGGSAWLAGTGTVNGAGDFGYLLSMVDGKLAGGPDRFRMKVTDRSTGIVVYDSQRGDPEKAAATTVPTCDAVELYTTRGVLAAGAVGTEGSDATTAAAAPAAFAFAQNFPNPFVASTRLHFDLPQTSRVRIVVYDMVGREVASVMDGTLPAGRHEQVWHSRNGNGGPVSPGVYFIRMRAEGLSGGTAFSMARRIVLLP